MGCPSFISEAAYAQLIANGRRTAGEEIDPPPVVKLFMSDAAGTWLLTELDPQDQDQYHAFSLSDLGIGSPELGYVSLQELTQAQTALGLMIRANEQFISNLPLSLYADAARSAGFIVEPATSSEAQP